MRPDNKEGNLLNQWKFCRCNYESRNMKDEGWRTENEARMTVRGPSELKRENR